MSNNTFSQWRLGVITLVTLIAIGSSGCGAGGAGDSSTAAATAPDPSAPAQAAPPTQSTPLSLSGQPATTVKVDATYSFAPTATASAGSELTYSVQHLPAWASFDTTSGTLSGTPNSSNVGTYSNIVISVADADQSASLNAFAITVTDTANGSATVSWTIPTANSDGSALTNLSGFRIYYGTAADSLTEMIQVANPGTSTYVIPNLTAATWYFGVKAYTSANVESTVSNIASKIID